MFLFFNDFQIVQGIQINLTIAQNQQMGREVRSSYWGNDLLVPEFFHNEPITTSVTGRFDTSRFDTSLFSRGVNSFTFLA